MSLHVTTALHCTKKLLQGLSGLTFLVDENWTPSNEMYTLPIAFFHLISCKENMPSEVSEKRIILYQSDAAEANIESLPVKQSVLEVIADNRINKPKTYTCDVIIPYGDLSKIFNHSFSAVNNALQFLETTELSNITLKVDGVDSSLKEVQSTIQSLYGSTRTFISFFNLLHSFFPWQGIQNFFSLTGATSFGFNTKSLEKMRNESAFCLFKNWDSWETKRVSIKNLTFDKKGTEDSFIRGTLELVETPIYTISSLNKAAKPTLRPANALEKALQGGISSFISFYKDGI